MRRRILSDPFGLQGWTGPPAQPSPPQAAPAAAASPMLGSPGYPQEPRGWRAFAVGTETSRSLRLSTAAGGSALLGERRENMGV